MAADETTDDGAVRPDQYRDHRGTRTGAPQEHVEDQRRHDRRFEQRRERTTRERREDSRLGHRAIVCHLTVGRGDEHRQFGRGSGGSECRQWFERRVHGSSSCGGRGVEIRPTPLPGRAHDFRRDSRQVTTHRCPRLSGRRIRHLWAAKFQRNSRPPSVPPRSGLRRRSRDGLDHRVDSLAKKGRRSLRPPNREPIRDSAVLRARVPRLPTRARV